MHLIIDSSKFKVSRIGKTPPGNARQRRTYKRAVARMVRLHIQRAWACAGIVERFESMSLRFARESFKGTSHTEGSACG